MKYGIAPAVVSPKLDLKPTEFLYYQDLPVMMANQHELGIKVPKNLEWTMPFLKLFTRGLEGDEYIYLSARHMFYDSENVNRPGWHSDGFGTQDLSIIWYDCVPTEFCIQQFTLSTDCVHSMEQMKEQASLDNIKAYDPGTVLLLDQYSIHRVAPMPFKGIRTFLKASISTDQYRLKGNSHNYLFEYDWASRPRDLERNSPTEKVECLAVA